MLKILGIVFLVILVVFAAMMVWGYFTGKGVQEDFYKAVLSGEPGRVLALLHPDFAKDVDEPVLEAWMAVFKKQLGEFKGLSKSSFSTKTENGVTTSRRVVEFENGEVNSTIATRDGKIVALDVKSERLEGVGVGIPADTTLFRERGRTFFETAAGGDPGRAYDMMHPNLKAAAGTREQFIQAVAGLQDSTGPLRSVKVLSEEQKPGAVPELLVLYELTWERGKTRGRVRFQFQGLRGHLVGYNLK